MTVRERLHQLVDEIPDPEVPAAERFLEYLRTLGDPVLRAFLTAPEDTEPILPDEAADSDRAWDAHLRGEDTGVPLDRFRQGIR